jgi:hypothetical protein
MSAVAVFLRAESPQDHRPQHSASKSLALLVLASYAAKWTDASKTAIQLTTNETWRQVKDRVRPSKTVPVLLPPLPYYDLDSNYPVMSRESDAREHRVKLWRTDAMIPARERVGCGA